MIVLGIGTNVGERLAHLRRALALLKAHPKIEVCAVSPVYESQAQLPDSAPASWNHPFFNAALTIKTDLSPFSLLNELQHIEQVMGRKKYGTWSPRNIDIDILLWGTLKLDTPALVIPHKSLFERPFALWPAMDLFSDWAYPRELLAKWGSRFDGKAPLGTKQLPYRIDGSVFVGALNITPDSFSDGAAFNSFDAAVAQAKKLFNAGAEVLDIGAEATSPTSTAIFPDEEWERLGGVLEELNIFWKGKEYGPAISVDTRHYTVAEKAIEAGATWINDVTGFNDPNMLSVVKNAPVKLVSMHSFSIPPSQQAVIPLDHDPIEYILNWGRAQLASFKKQGIAPERVILDPGVGFGKTPEQNLTLIRRAGELKELGVAIFVGHSRKSFHQVVTAVPAAERDLETAIGSVSLFNQNIDYIRVHDVAYSLRAVAMQKRLAHYFVNKD